MAADDDDQLRSSGDEEGRSIDRSSLEGLFDDLLKDVGARVKPDADDRDDGKDQAAQVSVDEVLDRLGHRSYGPLLMLVSLIAIMPVVGALPGVSYGAAFLSLLISVQFLFSQPKLWAPGFIRRRAFSRKALKTGVEKSRPVLRWIDGFITERFTLALKDPMPRLLALVCVVLSVLMVIYAAVPGGVVIPAVAILLIALGLTTHDGLVTGMGVLAAAAAIGASWWLVTRFL